MLKKLSGLLLLALLLTPVCAVAQNVIIEGQVKKEAEKADKLPPFKAKPKPGNKQPQNKLLEEVVFYYKVDEEARYVDLKNQYQNKHRGEIPLAEAENLAWQAYRKATVERPLEKWLYHGGASPNIFTGKAHLFNKTKNALLDVKLDITLRARVGKWLVNPDIQMTDFAYLVKTAQWRTLWQESRTVPVVAPGEEMLVRALGRFNILRFMRLNPNEWPMEMELTVRAPALNEQVKTTLELVPDHFLVPVLY